MESIKKKNACVIVPAKNEESVIAKCIRSLIGAGLDPLDIYVVDDGSTDKTGLIAGSYGVKVLRNCLSLGKVGSIKRAIDYFGLGGQYNYISLFDADSQLSANYFQETQKAFTKDKDVVLVCGYVESLKYNWITAARALEYMWSQAVYKRGQDKMGAILVSPGCASVYKSSVIKELELSGDTLVEDMDMTFQIHRKKLGKIVFSETSVSYTQDPRTLSDYCKQMYRWYFGMWQVILKHHVPFKFQRIDFEAFLLILEAFLMPFCYLFFFVKSPITVVWVAIADQIISHCIAAYFFLKTGRIDILKYCSIFPFVKLCNAAIFLQTFFEAVVLKRKLQKWFTPQRYDNKTPPNVFLGGN